MRLSVNVLMFALVVVNSMWGGAFIVLKLVQQTFTVPQILFARVIFAAILYAIFLPKVWPKQLPRKDLPWLAALVLAEPCLLFTFETLALANTTASQGSMIVACVPLAVAGAAWFFQGEKISRRCLMGILAAVAGVVLVSFAGGGESDSAPHPLLGNFFMLLAVCSSTAYALLIKRMAVRYSFIFLSALQVIGGSLFFLVPALLDPWPANVSWQDWLGLAYLGFGITFCVYFTINYSLTRIKAAHVMLFSNLIPIMALILAFVVLDERLLPLQYVGVALVLGGIALAGAPDQEA